MPLLRTELDQSECKSSRAHAYLAEINAIPSGFEPCTATTPERPRTYVEGAEARVATVGDLEAEMVQTKADLESMMVRLNAALTGEGNPKMVMGGVVNETASTFSNAAFQLNRSSFVRFKEGIKSVFGSMR